MAKRRRLPESEREPGRAPAQEIRPELDPSLLDQSALGNQALQAQFTGGEERAAPGLDVVRDVALPKLERAIIALQFLPREGEQVGRFVDILRRSALDDERKQALVDKLLTDQAAAEAVTESVERWLGGDGEAWRSELVELLELSFQGLEHGEPGAGGWVLDTGERVAVADSEEESVAQRATGLVGDVAETLASEEVSRRLGDVRGAVEGYVRTVVLAILLEEEEEEEELWGEVVVEES